jgi:prepilin-type processing-associated H-X9-DG protein
MRNIGLMNALYMLDWNDRGVDVSMYVPSGEGNDLDGWWIPARCGSRTATGRVNSSMDFCVVTWADVVAPYFGWPYWLRGNSNSARDYYNTDQEWLDSMRVMYCPTSGFAKEKNAKYTGWDHLTPPTSYGCPALIGRVYGWIIEPNPGTGDPTANYGCYNCFNDPGGNNYGTLLECYYVDHDWSKVAHTGEEIFLAERVFADTSRAHYWFPPTCLASSVWHHDGVDISYGTYFHPGMKLNYLFFDGHVDRIYPEEFVPHGMAGCTVGNGAETVTMYDGSGWTWNNDEADEFLARFHQGICPITYEIY